MTEVRTKNFFSDETDPYRNLSVEDCLLDLVGEGEIVLFLWRNAETVVIGRNQNVWSTCKSDLMRAEGVRLARRYSGGGAVYHDMGNLNFSFIAREGAYNLQKQYYTVLRSLGRLGINAVLSGRNDIVFEFADCPLPLKCSGNAFREKDGCCCHHGTLLVSADIERMQRYLAVDWEKISSKGVESVSARVGNLSLLRPSITAEELADSLIASFGEVYGVKSEAYSLSLISQDEISRREQLLRSRDWLYGRRSECDCEVNKRFSWGAVQIQLRVERGTVAAAQVFSDALDTEFIEAARSSLCGCEFSGEALSNAFESIGCADGERRAMSGDISRLLSERF